MTTTKEHICNIIHDICRRKIELRREPAHALLITEVMPLLGEKMTCDELHSEVEKLHAAGLVKVGDTATDWYAKPTQISD